MHTLRTYACTSPTPIYESPWTHDRVAENGSAHLDVGNTHIAQPVENNHVWIATGIGFVPDDTVQPCFSYQVTADTPIYQDHRPDAPVAEGGQARLRHGTTLLGMASVHGWVWISSGIGFIPLSTLRVLDAQLYTVQPGDNLSSISQQFYGTPDNWRHIYLANRPAIGPSPDVLFESQQLLIP
jgi:hypothetical protein